MYLLYSFNVVAPMQWSSPLAKRGFKMFAPSKDESPFAPEPMRVCISSMNRMMFPFDDVTSFITAFILSSNSPRYLAPATREATSSSKMVFFFRDSGTSPLKILHAKPSTTAVFPTPG